MRISEASLAVVDTDTTGLYPLADDRIVEFAYAYVDPAERFGSFLVNPGMEIPCVTSAIHHITDEDVAYQRKWGSAMDYIPTLFERETIFVAHNAKFDSSFLPCLPSQSWLCTKRLAMHLYPDAPGHSNQVLRYWLGGAKLDLMGLFPHRALADCIVTRFIFGKLVDRYLTDGHEDSVQRLAEFVAAPIKCKAIGFGKHKGTRPEDLPRDYIEWCLREMKDLDSDLRSQFQEILRRTSVPR